MGFEQLLGNSRLKENLSAGIGRGRASHFYLISGPAGSGKRTLARLLSAAILCTGETKPCLHCNHCRKAMADTHPDKITVTDPDHKNVAVKLVRQMRDDLFVRPNEGDKKIYIFPQELGIEGQNALLKTLEEPPGYGVFILLSDNPEKLLPTIRSRATELRLSALDTDILKTELRRRFPDADVATLEAGAERSGGYLGQALTLLEQDAAISPQTEAFVTGFGQKQQLTLLGALSAMEKWDRERLIKELTQWLQLLQQALVCRSGVSVTWSQARRLSTQRSSADILQAIRQLQKTIEYAQGNVSTAAICGYLTWVLR